jgi:hypothetical protein
VAVPTIVAGDYVPLSLLNSTGALAEVVFLTAYTSGATTGTVIRGVEGTTGVAHSNGATVEGAPITSDFTVAALDPAVRDFDFATDYSGLSLQGYVSGDLTVTDGRLVSSATKGPGNYLYAAPPAGDWIATLKAIVSSTGTCMFGIIALPASGDGVAGGFYMSAPDGPLIGSVDSTGTYSGTSSASGGPKGSFILGNATDTWYRLRKVGSTYYLALSANGRRWSAECSLAGPSTPTKVGFGCWYGSINLLDVDYFDIS